MTDVYNSGLGHMEFGVQRTELTGSICQGVTTANVEGCNVLEEVVFLVFISHMYKIGWRLVYYTQKQYILGQSR